MVLRYLFGTLLTSVRRRRRMDVTSVNFKERLPEIERAIETATFVCIDGEFTGLNNVLRGISSLDTPAERYIKMKESARQFLLVQFGLCTFHYDTKTDGYKYACYNFYVWPRQATRNAPDPRFMCQTSSIDFLVKHKFDFNKLFSEGVSYMRPLELAKLRENLKEKQQLRRQSLTSGDHLNNDIPVPEDQEQFLAGVSQKLEELVSGDQEELELEKSNSFQRRLIYQTARQHFPQLSLSPVQKQNGDRIIRVVKSDKEEQERLAALRDETEAADLEEALGFSRVIAKISSSGKPVLGHNMFLDVCHTINQFCDVLPDSYMDFKALTTSVFPRIVDTKVMANTSPFKQEMPNSSLEELHQAVQQSPYSLPSITPLTPHLGYVEGEKKNHEAAYDAYITGLCFIAMSNRFGQLISAAEKKGGEGVCILPDNVILKPFFNKIHMMKSDISYVNLAAEDIIPDRSHVFHLTFPAEWKTADIIHLFSSFCHVFVSWIDDTSAFVSLKEKDWADQILPTLQSRAANTFTVQTYQDFLKSKENRIVSSQNSGITPTLEKIPFNLSVGNRAVSSETSKRQAHDDNRSTKRMKSVTEDEKSKKTFDEPEWD